MRLMTEIKINRESIERGLETVASMLPMLLGMYGMSGAEMAQLGPALDRLRQAKRDLVLWIDDECVARIVIEDE